MARQLSLLDFLVKARENIGRNNVDARELHNKIHLLLLDIIKQYYLRNDVCGAYVVSRLLDTSYYGGSHLMYLTYLLHGLCVKTLDPDEDINIIYIIELAKEQVKSRR